MGTGLGLWWRAWISCGAVALLRGRRGTWRHPPLFHVAGVALGDIHRRFAWQAWHLGTSIVVSRGRRGTCGTGLGGALGSPVRRGTFAWQAWRLATSAVVSRGRRGTWDIYRRFAWQAWYLWDWAGSGGTRLAGHMPPLLEQCAKVVAVSTKHCVMCSLCVKSGRPRSEEADLSHIIFHTTSLHTTPHTQTF